MAVVKDEVKGDVELAKQSKLMQKRLNTEQIVELYNNPNSSLADKCYLKTVIAYTLGIFASQPVKTSKLFNTIIQLSRINDEEIFRGIINHLATVCQQENLINSHALQGLSQVLWGNEQYSLSAQEVNILLDLLKAKLEPTVSSLEQFGRLLDSIVDTKVIGVSEEKIKNITNQLDKWVKLTKDKEIKYRLAYAKQAILHIGDDQTRLDIAKRKAIVFLEGLQYFGMAGGQIVTAAISGASTYGATVPFAMPGITLNIVRGCMRMKVVFETSDKQGWYVKLREFQAILIGHVYSREKYTPRELKELSVILEELKKAKRRLRLDLTKTLGHIIAKHPDHGVKDYCIDILCAYCVDKKTASWLKDRILATLVNIECCAVKSIIEQISKLNLAIDYARVKQELTAIIKVPEIPVAVDIIELGQNNANLNLQGAISNTLLVNKEKIVDLCNTQNLKPFVILDRMDKEVKTLLLTKCSLTDVSIANLFKFLHEYPALEEINLWKNFIGIKAATAIAIFLANASCKKIIINETSLGNQEAVILAEGLARNKSLKSLDVGYNNLGDEGVIAICTALLNHPSIEELSILSAFTITEKGVTAVLDLVQTNCRIIYLDLNSLFDNNSGKLRMKDLYDKLNDALKINRREVPANFIVNAYNEFCNANHTVAESLQSVEEQNKQGRVARDKLRNSQCV